MGKLIDTVVHGSLLGAGETVECPLHVQDLKAIDQSPYRNRQFISFNTRSICALDKATCMK